MTHSLTAPTAEDTSYIQDTLGRVPRGIIAVSARDPKGTPIALKMECVVGKTPFPTHFWLCHDVLIEKINYLESQRIVKPLEKLIEDNLTFQEAFKNDQLRYQALRNKELTPEGIVFLKSIGIYEEFTVGRGIGGIENFTKVRCLHMQVAHLVSDDNQVGQWLEKHFSILDFEETLTDFRQRLKSQGLIEDAFQKSL